MSDEKRTKRKVSFDQIPGRQRASLEAQRLKVSKGTGCGCLLIFVVLLIIVFNVIFGDDDKPSKRETPPPVESQQPIREEVKPPKEDKKPVPDLGEHWIKDANAVYLWNPKPQEGETITWSGGYIQDGDYKFADGSGIVTWYLNGELKQVDEGTFRHGQRHGKFTHKFPGGRIILTNLGLHLHNMRGDTFFIKHADNRRLEIRKKDLYVNNKKIDLHGMSVKDKQRVMDLIKKIRDYFVQF